MSEEMDSVIWIGISPDLLLGGLDTQSLLKCDHFLEFIVEVSNFGSKETVKQEIENDAIYSDSSNNGDINISLDATKDVENIKQLDNQKHIKDEGKTDEAIKCDQCNKSFKLEKDYVRHKRMSQCVDKGEVRPSLAPRICPECGKTISGNKHLKDHIKAVHLKIKVFRHQCSQCERGFVKSVHLTSHIESVHQQETFYCHFCPRSFHASAYLSDHLRRQHNNTAVECQNCHQKFVNRENLDIHIQTGICSEENKEIKRHKKKKRNERRVTCSYCQMNITKDKLKKHVDNVHIKGSGVSSKENTIVCGYCDYRTPFNQKLHNHIKIMHPTISLPNEIETS